MTDDTEEWAEIQRMRDLPKRLETTGEKIRSACYDAIIKMLAAGAPREELRISQVELAERMGTESSARCRRETFKAVNSLALMQWAEALNCSIDLGLNVQTREMEETAAK